MRIPFYLLLISAALLACERKDSAQIPADAVAASGAGEAPSGADAAAPSNTAADAASAALPPREADASGGVLARTTKSTSLESFGEALKGFEDAPSVEPGDHNLSIGTFHGAGLSGQGRSGCGGGFRTGLASKPPAAIPQEIEVKGEYNPEIVKRIARHKRKGIAHCYKEHAPPTGTRLVVTITLGAGDALEPASVAVKGEGPVSACVQERVQAWSFPARTSGPVVSTLTYVTTEP